MKGRNDWIEAARTAGADDLREHILSGYKGGKPFTPYVPTLALPNEIGSVLDFGCGLGRNFPLLKDIAGQVEGYDLPPMIERCRSLAPVAIDRLSDDWHEVKARRFALVFASLVLQHIEPAAVEEFLRDFAKMAPVTYLLTRTENDFGPAVLDLVAATGRFEPGECVEVDHEPATHRLRVIGRTSFDDARASGPGRHYELLLRSTVRP